MNDPATESNQGQPVDSQQALNEVLKTLVKDQRRGWIGTAIFRVFTATYLIISLILTWHFMSNMSADDPELVEDFAAIVEIYGPIVAGKYQPNSSEQIIDRLATAFESDAKGIILDINSPGGSPVESRRTYHALLRMKAQFPDKPVYAVAGDMAASGAYYIAAAADKIYADPTSMVGSIGVIMEGFGFDRLMRKHGIERRVYTAGKNKALLDPFQAPMHENVLHIESMLSQIHTEFIADVRATRGHLITSSDEEVFNGLIWTGREAMELGLIDELSSPREVAFNEFGVSETRNLTQDPSRIGQLLNRLSVNIAHELKSAIFTLR